MLVRYLEYTKMERECNGMPLGIQESKIPRKMMIKINIYLNNNKKYKKESKRKKRHIGEINVIMNNSKINISLTKN